MLIVNLTYLFNNFKNMCCGIYHNKINLFNTIFGTILIAWSSIKYIQCGLHKLCEGTSGFYYYSKGRKSSYLSVNFRRWQNVRASTASSRAIKTELSTSETQLDCILKWQVMTYIKWLHILIYILFRKWSSKFTCGWTMQYRQGFIQK